MRKISLLCATTALAFPSLAYGQSTGSEAVEEEVEVVVTGSRISNGVAGVVVPDVPKTRSILTQDIISRQAEGQSILQTINLIPAVNYTNVDPYGSAGGNLRIRGFPGNRIALIWDGLPLNDTGNYAIFGNQQMDPEVIDRVSVNLGTTDVDSPTPSAAGGVVSYRSMLPTEEFGALLKGSIGDFNYFRTFAMLNSGSFTSFGTRAWVSGSETEYEKFRGPGKLHKRQFNGRIYQPLGTNGDFVSLAGHFNRNRNNSYNSGTAADYAVNRSFDNIPVCVRDLGDRGVVDNDNAGSTTNNSQQASCSNYFNLRVNPSSTGNVRGSMRFTLGDGLILTADPGYQRSLANGGGTTTLVENAAQLKGAGTAAGVDLNGDGDVLDTVRVYNPNNTRTNRYTFLTSLIWEATEQHRLRVAYSFDRGEHRQTGEFGRVFDNGDPIDVFGGKYNEQARILTADGKTLQNRDRYSVASLQQLSGEYFGRFLDNRLTVTVGVRAPFFERELNQYCFTQISSGNPLCTSEPIAAGRIIAPGTPRPPAGFAGNALFAPFERTVKYSPILPSAGISYEFGAASVYASYGKNFSSPSTDNLYRSLDIDVLPEKTDAFEAGVRYRSSRIQAQLATYYTDYQNRIVSAQDLDPNSPTFSNTLDRNVGDARAYGLDGQVSWSPVREFTLYGYGSYINSRLKDDILGTALATAAANSPCPPGTPVGTRCTIVSVQTAGAEFVETPKYSFGGRAQGNFGAFSVGAQFKWVSKRFTTDDNGRSYNATKTAANTVPILDEFGRTPAYTTVDMDAQIDFGRLGFALDRTRLKLSVTNLFDKFYFGNISTQSTNVASTRFAVGAPRTVQATLAVGF